MMLVQGARKLIRRLGVDVVKYCPETDFPPDITDDFVAVYKMVRPFTMTSSARIFSLCEAVKYLQENNIQGDVVECGVWRGGSMMAIAEVLKQSGSTNRDLYLFDTFEGMSLPSEHDVDLSGVTASKLMASHDKKNEDSVWCIASIEEVDANLKTVGYPPDKIHLIKGMVENTIPAGAPDKIALLRLDTDWYESTKHEMEHLFPRLVPGGVLIIDDYGHWQGARKAIDEYLREHHVRILLNRIDYTGRIAVKV